MSPFLPFPSPRHTTPEKFFIEACDEGADAVLAIDRVSNEMTLTGGLFESAEHLMIQRPGAVVEASVC